MGEKTSTFATRVMPRVKCALGGRLEAYLE